ESWARESWVRESWARESWARASSAHEFSGASGCVSGGWLDATSWEQLRPSSLSLRKSSLKIRFRFPIAKLTEGHQAQQGQSKDEFHDFGFDVSLTEWYSYTDHRHSDRLL